MPEPPARPNHTAAADPADLVARCAGLPLPRLVEALREDQARRWRAGERPLAEAYQCAGIIADGTTSLPRINPLPAKSRRPPSAPVRTGWLSRRVEQGRAQPGAQAAGTLLVDPWSPLFPWRCGKVALKSLAGQDLAVCHATRPVGKVARWAGRPTPAGPTSPPATQR